MYSLKDTMKSVENLIDEENNYDSYLIIGMPLRDNTPPAQNVKSQEYIDIDVIGYSTGYVDIIGETVDVARNYIMETALSSNAKYLLFMGEDTVLPFDGFQQLHKTAEANPGCVVSGVYYTKFSVPMIRIQEGRWIKPADVAPGKIIEAHNTGMDAMLIPVNVLRKLKEMKPNEPFCLVYNEYDEETDSRYMIGEDYYFSYRLREAGIKLLVDTNVQCLHVDLATGKYTAHPSVDLNNYHTKIKITEPLTMADKIRVDNSWEERLPPLPNLLYRTNMIGD